MIRGTPFTRESIHDQQLLDARWVVDDPARLPGVVREMMVERESD
jgi:hypothetical protein